ncbi:hypothetical protein ABW20_dc0103726 [Dactylellina cionopaga]|nr:hypothetical protein ABW20_dc0103726 [Dactylellina cionopaga]
MRSSIAIFAAALLSIATAQDGSSITSATDGLITILSSTTSAPESTITLAPEVCLTADLGRCYYIISTIDAFVYLILTVTDSAGIPPDAEPITSGDPILSESGNIATATDQSVEALTTAVLGINYSESLGTTCDPATITSTLSESPSPACIQGTQFFSAPPQVTKTRVVIKAREDTGQNKETEDGGNNPTSPAPDGNTNLPVNTETTPTPTPAPESPTEGAPTQGPTTENPAPTTEDAPQPTENTTGTNPTSSENTPQETENPTGTMPPTTIAGDAGTTSATIGSTSDTSMSEDTPSSDSTFPTTDTSIPSYTDSTPADSTSIPTDSNTTPADSLTTLVTSSQQSSSGAPTGANQNERGKPEVTTSFTTIAEVSNGSTKLVTSAVATMTRSAAQTSSTGGSGAGSNYVFNAEFLLGAVGMAAVLGF